MNEINNTKERLCEYNIPKKDNLLNSGKNAYVIQN